jgi:predicted nucleic acid-binding protein
VVVRAEATDEAAARSIIYRYADKDFSLTDAISFAIMARLGLSQAFTFDKHFEQYGWRVLHA